MPVSIRPIRAEDAPAFLNLTLALDRETAFMMLEPGERTTTVDEQRRRIETLLAADNQMIFVAADHQAGIVGFLGAYGGAYRRSHDTVHIVIGLRAAFSGQGIGARLFEAMESWARSWGAHRLELTVMCHNDRAAALYQKMGFQIEGIQTGSLKISGQYIDQYAMSKILEQTK